MNKNIKLKGEMTMYQSTQEQKEKYLQMISAPESRVGEMISELNKVLKDYVKISNAFYRGIYNEEYFKSQRAEALSQLQTLTSGTYATIKERLEEIKSAYLIECFPTEETTDPLELNFISKELELMDKDELISFYKDNALDKNKVRLFDIELKRRGKVEGKTAELATIIAAKENFYIGDVVTRAIEEKVRFYDGCRQFSLEHFYLCSNEPGTDQAPSMKSYKDIISSVDNMCRSYCPENLNIIDLAK